MPSIQIEAQFSSNKLLEVVDQFSQKELDQFVSAVIALRARRQAPSLPKRESELLMRINQHLPAEVQARFDELVIKRQEETLTHDEHEELMRLIEQVEASDVERLKALAELAQFRGISIDELMNQLGIRPPEYA